MIIDRMVYKVDANRPYAYDVTEGRPGALGVKRGTATCAIAKHAARGPYRRTGRPGLRTDWEAERQRSATSLDPKAPKTA